MTKIQKSTARSQATRLSAGQIIFCISSVIILVLTFINSETVISSMSEGMKICTSTVIPALFPFMVLSQMLVCSGAADFLSRALGGLFLKLFGIRKEAAIAFVLGAVCGFPIGARSALSLYQSGRISRSELEHLLCFCNGPSSAFLISAVGISLFGSRELGFLLYACDLLSAIIIGVAARAFFEHKGQVPSAQATKGQAKKKASRPMGSIVSAINSSALSMLSICAFITFFSALVGIIQAYAQKLGIQNLALSLILGFFEMTGGTASASSLPPLAAALCSAAIIGWSGLSVHFQLLSLFGDCEPEPSFFPYFTSKAVRSAICVILVAIGLKIFDSKISICPSSSPSFIYSRAPHPIHIFTLLVFFTAAFCTVRKMTKKSKY